MKVFISHTHDDGDLAVRVADALQKAGLETWHDRCLMPGDNWAEKVSEALNESEAMVVLLTPRALADAWVLREVEFALGNRQYAWRLVPVLVGPRGSIPERSIPWILRRLDSIEITDPDDDEDGIGQIAETLLKAA